MRNYLITILLCMVACNKGFAAVTQFELYPNIHTVGISLRFNSALPIGANTQTFISQKIGNAWSSPAKGFELSRVSVYYLAGCVFDTKAATWYKIRVIVSKGATVIADETDSVSTLADPELITPLKVYYVSPTGSGISQNKNSPGELNQVLLNGLKAGDRVILLEGSYYTGELKMKSSGTAAAPISFVAENNLVIINGSQKSAMKWTRVTQDTLNKDYNLFYTNLGALNTNCIVKGNSRMYPYRNIQELSTFSSIRAIDPNGNPNGIFKIGVDGFFRDGRSSSQNHFPYTAFNPNTYIKFVDGKDTSGRDLHVSIKTSAISVSNQKFIQFKGIRFKYFGAAAQNNDRCAILAENSDNIFVDSCGFEFCDRGIVFIGNSDHNVIQHSNFNDDFAKLSYFQFKETGLDYQHLNSNFPNFFPFQARNIEPGRIYFDRGYTGRGNIIRYNSINGGCDGITCPPTPGDSNTARHFDIYGNTFGPGSDDAFEVDGNASNIRVWDNEMYGAGNAISVSSPCYGPVYIYRNVMRDFRKTVYEYVVNIVTLISDTIPGSPLKLNAAYCDIPGMVYFMHNTVSSGHDAYGLVLFQPQSQSSWSKVVARNNIFYTNSQHYALWVRATDSVDLDYNNYFNPKGFKARQDRPSTAIYNNFNSTRAGILGNINLPGSFIEKNGYSFDPAPGWQDTASRNFHLVAGAAAIDKGVHIPGFNDGFSGSAPDLGAFEYQILGTKYTKSKIEMGLFPNPVENELVLLINSNKPGTVELFDINAKLLSRYNIHDIALVINVGFLNAGFYVLRYANGEATSSKIFVKK